MESDDIIRINVGGKLFTTTATTLMISPYFNSFLTRWNKMEVIFIDRDPEGFENILGLLRDPNYPYNSKYNYELEYFQLTNFITPIVKEFHSISNGASTGGKETILRWNKLTMKTNRSYIITIPCQEFLDCPILNTNKFTTVNIYKDKLLLDSLDKIVVSMYNSIYHSRRSDDNPCIRLPIFHHTAKQYKKNNYAEHKLGPINLEFIFDEVIDDEPLALFYEMSDIDKSLTAPYWYNTHKIISEKYPPGMDIIWVKGTVHTIISEIWLYVSVPIINIIVYLDDTEIVCTYHVLEELANGKGIFPLHNHYVIQNMVSRKTVSINICITIPPVVERVTATAIICKVQDYPKTMY
jgi:hypothetical protein